MLRIYGDIYNKKGERIYKRNSWDLEEVCKSSDVNAKTVLGFLHQVYEFYSKRKGIPESQTEALEFRPLSEGLSSTADVFLIPVLHFDTSGNREQPSLTDFENELNLRGQNIAYLHQDICDALLYNLKFDYAKRNKPDGKDAERQTALIKEKLFAFKTKSKGDFKSIMDVSDFFVDFCKYTRYLYNEGFLWGK